MELHADANKVIKKLLTRIAQLEEQNAILFANLEEVIELNTTMNKIEEENKK